MPGLKKKSNKEGLLRKVRRKRLHYITVLPSLVTILNGICGFTAIVLAAKGTIPGIGSFSYHRLEMPYFAIAGYLILLAMIADMLDGRLARMSKSTSSFGGQLDSLCDIISFGVAPAFLMLKVMEYKFASFEGLNPAVENFLDRFIWLCAAAYISCAAIRLARFNVENEENESAHMSFMGLPSPAAAGVVVSLVIFHQEMLPELAEKGTLLYLIGENTIIYCLPFFTLAAGILMIGRLRYPHVVNQYAKGKKPLAYLLMCLLVIGLIIWFRQIAFVLAFCGFAASGLVKPFFYKITRSASTLGKPENAVVGDVDSTDILADENA